MTEFEVSILPKSFILHLYSLRPRIQVDPPYQRMGDVWTLDKKQLLIDSLLNEFDVPKIYFHNVTELSKGKYRYAIVDGRQRLEAIWRFIDNKFSLADDFKHIQKPDVWAAGLTYSELAEKYPAIRQMFDATPLSVYLITTPDIDLIEEMFTRLNEAVPLNAAEKRNAFGGPLPKIIREIAQHEFFNDRVRVSNSRYQHRDLAAKLIMLECHQSISDTKKVYLDDFVRVHKSKKRADFSTTIMDVKKILGDMSGVFTEKDRLLRSSGMIVLYYWLFHRARNDSWRRSISRKKFVEFESLRKRNRTVAADSIARANYNLLEFDRLMQTPNDSYAIIVRYAVLSRYLRDGKVPEELVLSRGAA